MPEQTDQPTNPWQITTASWVDPLVLEAEDAHAREAEVRERSQHLVFAADAALKDLAQACTWLDSTGHDDAMAFRRIQEACARLRRGIAVATGQDA